MRVVAIISAFTAIAAILLFVASETSISPLDLPLETFKWRYFMGVLVVLSVAGWAWDHHRITELQHEIAAAKQEIRDVYKFARASRASRASL